MPRRRGTRNAAWPLAPICLMVAPTFALRSRQNAHSAAPLAAELRTPRPRRHRAIPCRLHHQRHRSLPPARPCPLCRRHQRRRRPPCHPRRTTRAKRAKRARAGSLQHRDAPRPALQSVSATARRRGTRSAAWTPARFCLLLALLNLLSAPRSRLLPAQPRAAPLAAELRPPRLHRPRPHASLLRCRRRHRCSRLTCRPRRPRRPAAT